MRALRELTVLNLPALASSVFVTVHKPCSLSWGGVWVRLHTAIFRWLKGRGQTSLWNSDVSSSVASLPFLIFSQPFNYCHLTYRLVCVAAHTRKTAQRGCPYIRPEHEE